MSPNHLLSALVEVLIILSTFLLLLSVVADINAGGWFIGLR